MFCRESQWERLLSKALEQRMDALICKKRFAASTRILHVDGVIGARHGAHRTRSPWKLQKGWARVKPLSAVIQLREYRERCKMWSAALEDSEYLWTCAELPCHHFLLSIQVWGSQNLLKELLLFISGGEHQVLLIHTCQFCDHLKKIGGLNKWLETKTFEQRRYFIKKSWQKSILRSFRVDSYRWFPTWILDFAFNCKAWFTFYTPSQTGSGGTKQLWTPNTKLIWVRSHNDGVLNKKNTEKNKFEPGRTWVL